MAGMDGNRTHPGRLSSAPQTVLKTAGVPSTSVHVGPRPFELGPCECRIIRTCSRQSITLAAFLAVVDRQHDPAYQTHQESTEAGQSHLACKSRLSLSSLTSLTDGSEYYPGAGQTNYQHDGNHEYAEDP